MLLGGRPLHLGDPLEEEAPALATLEPDREDRVVETVGDRADLGEDLDLLGVGPHEVEDPVVGRLGVLDQRGECGHGLAAPRGSVDQKCAAVPGELGDRREDAVLPGARTVREQRRACGRDLGRWRGHLRRRTGPWGFEAAPRPERSEDVRAYP